MLVGERILGPIHTNPFFFKKRRFFPSGLAYRPLVPGENSHRKRTFSKKLARIEIFENAGFSFTCVRMNTEDFEYDDVIHQKYII